MNPNFINGLMRLSIEELEKKLNSLVFSDKESELYEKSKDLIDAGFNMSMNDSGDKVLYAAIIYYILKNKKKSLDK